LVAVAVGFELLLVVALEVNEVAPDVGVELALAVGVAPVGEVVEVDEQPVAVMTTRAAMARRFMLRLWWT
jgi:hypothetical protein